MVEYLNLHTGASLLTALALGGMVFFSFVVAPLLFKQLGVQTAAAFMGKAFPVYYRITALLTGTAGLLIYYRSVALALWAVCALSLISWLVLLPLAERQRPGRAQGDPIATRRFRSLHRLSVVINLAQIVVLLIVFVILSA